MTKKAEFGYIPIMTFLSLRSTATLTLVMIFLHSQPSRAESTASHANSSSSGLGFAVGYSSGLGIAYRRHLESDWGYQSAGILFGDKDNFSAVLGLHVMKTLSKTESLRFYWLVGAGVFHTSERVTEWSHRNNVGIGSGLGIEIPLSHNTLTLSLDLPLTLILENSNGWDFGGVYPIPAASLIYYF